MRAGGGSCPSAGGFVPPVYRGLESTMTGILISVALFFVILVVILLIVMRK
jgi:hypothetical protein